MPKMPNVCAAHTIEGETMFYQHQNARYNVTLETYTDCNVRNNIKTTRSHQLVFAAPLQVENDQRADLESACRSLVLDGFDCITTM